MGYYKDRKVNRQTQICIEGFQRSGNTFFKRLFSSHNKNVKVAHHNHSSASIKKAIKRGIPIIVLVRHPLGAISSLIAWDNSLSICIALKAYRMFYQPLMSLKAHFWMLQFEHFIDDPISHVNSINLRFDTSFEKVNFSKEEFQSFKQKTANSTNSPFDSPLPNEEKENRKARIQKDILSHRDYPKTIRVYQNFIGS